MMDKDFEFTAQVKEVKSKVTSSNDKEYLIRLITDDPNVLALGIIDGQTLIKLKVSVIS